MTNPGVKSVSVEVALPGRKGDLAQARLKLAVPAYITAIVAAELLAVFVSVPAGLFLDAAIVVLCLNHYAFAERDATGSPDPFRVLLALPLLPIIAITSYTMMVDVGPVAQQALAGVPAFAAVAVIARLHPEWVLGLLRGSSLRNQAPVALAGIPLSLGAYLLARSTGFAFPTSGGQVVAGVIVLFLFVGVVEEVIFRGLLQDAFVALFGRAGLALGSALFALAYAGSRNAGFVLFMAVVGRSFAQSVQRTRSLAGVTVAHTFLSIGMLILWPVVLR